MEIKTINPKMKQKEKAKELRYSISTLHLYSCDIKMPSPHESNNSRKTPKTSNDLNGPQMTSKYPKKNDKPVSKNV